MSDLIDHLAQLTQLRDIDVLDSALCGLTRELLRCEKLAIHRLIRDGSNQRWLTTARLVAGQHAPLGPADTEPATLPLLDERPEWRDCLLVPRMQLPPEGADHVTLHAMGTDTEAVGVMEITTLGPPTAEQDRMVASLLVFYRHLRGLMNENERDSLTGLLNRKSFDEAFLRAAMEADTAPPEIDLGELERRDADAPAARYWLAVVDIDHFKRVNDNHGHLIGDEVLLLVAQLMRNTFRYGDRIYRFGGEEFVVLLRCPDAPSAQLAFERLRRRIESHEFPQVGQLTVSIGFTTVVGDDTPSAAFARADRAVYQAKEDGRNRTIAHDSLEPLPPAEAPPACEAEFF
jgi:diguanylate cyclase (GGDEF)-like protein